MTLFSERIFSQLRQRIAGYPTHTVAVLQYPREESFSLLTFPDLVPGLWLYCLDLSPKTIPEYFSSYRIYLNEPGFSCPDQLKVSINSW